MISEKSITDRFERYVRCSSESSHEAAFATMLAAELQEMGCTEVGFDDAGIKTGGDAGNLGAVLEGLLDAPPILLAAHLDTVSPGVGIEPVIKDGVIRSNSATILGADDKSGVSAIMEALSMAAVLSPDMRRTVEILFTVSEEAGLLGSANASMSNRMADRAVVFDSSEPLGSIINEGPWAVRLKVTLTGKAAHAAIRPEEGIHALRIGAEMISEMRLGRLHQDLTVNVANFLSPGQGNIIPDKVNFELEVRSFGKEILDDHLEELTASMNRRAQAAGAGITMERHELLPGFLVSPDSTLIAELGSVMRATGMEPRLVRTFGGSDAANLNKPAVGPSPRLQAVNIGTGMKKSHSLEEYIAVADMARCAEVALRLMTSGGRP